MTQLNQLLAIIKGAQQTAAQAVTKVYHTVQKDDPFNGSHRVYTPRDDEGEGRPDEGKPVQTTVADLLSNFRPELTRLLDVNFERDVANTEAFADVTLPDGTVVISQAPVTYLLFLEKQLNDLHTLITKLPRLSPGETWSWDPSAGAFATPPVETTTSKKVPRSHVLYDATREHPAQVQAYMEDVVVGTWSTRKFSGALPADVAESMLARVRELRDAVKQARELANTVQVPNVALPGDVILSYVFDGTTL